MADEDDEKKSLVQRLTQDKAGLKLTATALVIGGCVLGYGYFGNSHSKRITQTADEQSATRKVAGIKEGAGTKSAMSPEDARLSHEQTNIDIQKALKTGGSETPPVLPPVDEQQALPSHLPVDKDETPSTTQTEKKMPDFPMPDEAPPVSKPVKTGKSDTKVINATSHHQLDPELLKSYQAEEMALSKYKTPAVTTVAFEDRTSGATSAGSKSSGGETKVYGLGIGDGHYLEENGQWHDAKQASLWHAGSSSSGSASGDKSPSRSSDADGSQSDDAKFKLPAPGTMLYSVLLGKVDSDAPGTVVAEIRQGAFNGARLLGAFNYTRDGVMISFKTMTFSYTDENGKKRPKTLPINAVALSEKDLSPAMATNIDRHLVESFAVNFAAGFLQGMGQAAASSGSSASYGVGGSTFSNAKLNTTDQLLYGFGQGANQLSSTFQSKYGNLRDTITVKAQTPFALLFLATSGEQ